MYTDYKDCIAKIMVSEEEIDKAVTRNAYEIEEDFKNYDKKLLLLGILKGSVIFMADIMKKLNIPLETDFIKVSSYGAGTTSGELRLKAEPDRLDLSEYNVVVIEDILDTGNTLSWMLNHRKKEIHIDYEGFVIPDEFIAGYGLDYDEKYRNLPFVGVLKPCVYENKD